MNDKQMSNIQIEKALKIKEEYQLENKNKS